MKTWAERGPYGRWLITARTARGLGTTEAGRAALAEADIRIAKSVYAQYEAGSKPLSREHLPLLEGYWGTFVDPLETTETPDDLVIALRDQTEAISALVVRLDTFVGPLGEMMADLLKKETRAAKARRSSDAATS